jgi:hypothetical protein
LTTQRRAVTLEAELHQLGAVEALIVDEIRHIQPERYERSSVSPECPPGAQSLALVDEHREPVVHDAVGLAIVFPVLTRPAPARPAGRDCSGA